MSKAEFIDRLDRWKTSSEALVTAYLLAHLMDLQSWGHICQEEMEDRIGKLTGIEMPGRKPEERMAGWIIREITG